MNKKTLVINLFGGAGVGKSTTCADIFAHLKKQQYSVEMVREWVKGWAYEKRKITDLDPYYIFAKQLKAEKMLFYHNFITN